MLSAVKHLIYLNLQEENFAAAVMSKNAARPKDAIFQVDLA